MFLPQYYQTNYTFSGTTTTVPPSKQDLGSYFVPVGTILLYGGTILPENYFWCDGSQKSKSYYSTLYSVIGDTYNIAVPNDGYFFIPNLTARFPIGASSASDMNITYQNNFVKNGGNSFINSSQLASHTHDVPSSSNSYVARSNDSTSNTHQISTTTNTSLYYIDNGANTTGDITGAVGQEFLPPFTVVNYIIKYQ